MPRSLVPVLALVAALALAPAASSELAARAPTLVDLEPGEAASPRSAHDLPVLACTAPLPQIPAPSGFALGWPMRALRVAVPVDAEFVAEHGDAWPERAVAMMEGVSRIYEREIGVRVEVVDLHAHTTQLAPEAPEYLLHDLRAHYLTAHRDLDRHAVHLLTGKRLDGGVLGAAMCIGGAGDDLAAYSLGQGAHIQEQTFLGVPIFHDAYVKVAAHELGHQLGGQHHLANCAEPALARGFDPDYAGDACTLMFNYVDFLSARMGAANRLVTRGTAERLS